MGKNEPIYRGTGDPLRDQKGLIEELKSDYKAVVDLWAQMQKRGWDMTDMDRLLQRIAWVKTDMEALRGLQKDQIEGICWGEMDGIEREIHFIQNKIRIRINRVLTDKLSPSVIKA